MTNALVSATTATTATLSELPSLGEIQEAERMQALMALDKAACTVTVSAAAGNVAKILFFSIFRCSTGSACPYQILTARHPPHHHCG